MIYHPLSTGIESNHASIQIHLAVLLLFISSPRQVSYSIVATWLLAFLQALAWQCQITDHLIISLLQAFQPRQVTSRRFQRALTSQPLERSAPVSDKEVMELAESHKTTRKFSRTLISYFTKIKDITENNTLNTEKMFVEKNQKMGFGMDYEQYVESTVSFLICFTRRLVYLNSGKQRLFIGKQIEFYLKITQTSHLETTVLQFSYNMIKGKAIPLQAWTGPEVSRRLMLPDFKTIGTGRW